MTLFQKMQSNENLNQVVSYVQNPEDLSWLKLNVFYTQTSKELTPQTINIEGVFKGEDNIMPDLNDYDVSWHKLVEMTIHFINQNK